MFLIDVACRCVTQVWDIMEQFDTGCTPGGGKDAMHVFYDAGLMFQSNNPRLGTPDRQGAIRFFWVLWVFQSDTFGLFICTLSSYQKPRQNEALSLCFQRQRVSRSPDRDEPPPQWMPRPGQVRNIHLNNVLSSASNFLFWGEGWVGVGGISLLYVVAAERSFCATDSGLH